VVEGEPGTPEEGDAVVGYERTVDDIPVWGSSVRVGVSGDGEITGVLSSVPSEENLVLDTTTPAITEAEAIALAETDEPGRRARDLQALSGSPADPWAHPTPRPPAVRGTPTTARARKTAVA